MLRHAVQLELYRVLISRWLEVNDLRETHFRVAERAGVWLMNEAWWTPIQDTDMKRSELIVKQLRSGDDDDANSLRSLMDAMVARPADVPWRLERRCEMCVYQGHCASEAAGTVRALPDQSAEAQTVMQSFLGEIARGSTDDIEDMFCAVKKLPRHVSLYFSEGELSEETTSNANIVLDDHSGSTISRPRAEDQEGHGGGVPAPAPGALALPPPRPRPPALPASGRLRVRKKFIFDHIEGVREARAVVVRGLGLLTQKEAVRRHVVSHPRAFQGRLVIAIERRCDGDDRPHPTVAFVMDSRGMDLTHDEHWMKRRILSFEEDEKEETALVTFRQAGETFTARGAVRRRRQSPRSLREVSIEKGDFERGDVAKLRLGNDGVYRLTATREEILRCEEQEEGAGAPPGPLITANPLVVPPLPPSHPPPHPPQQQQQEQQGQQQQQGRRQHRADTTAAVAAASGSSTSAPSYVHMMDNLPAGMATQLFRSRQKLSACAAGRVSPYHAATKHRVFPLFAEDVGVYLSVDADHHLGEAGSEYVFSWTALVRFHAANVERVVSHSPKSKAAPHETLIEFIHALFSKISDHNDELRRENENTSEEEDEEDGDGDGDGFEDGDALDGSEGSPSRVGSDDDGSDLISVDERFSPVTPGAGGGGGEDPPVASPTPSSAASGELVGDLYKKLAALGAQSAGELLMQSPTVERQLSRML